MKSSKIYYILEGTGNIMIEGEKHTLQKDDSVYVPPNSKQFIENSGIMNLKFVYCRTRMESRWWNFIRITKHSGNSNYF